MQHACSTARSNAPGSVSPSVKTSWRRHSCRGRAAHGARIVEAEEAELAEPVDIVDIFRRPEFVPEVVDQAIQLQVPAIWMQEGVIHEGAAEKARRAGIFVIMDRCILKEHRARFG